MLAAAEHATKTDPPAGEKARYGPIMTLPTMTPIQSSTVSEIGHDGAHLYVRFKGGALYRYPGADASHVETMAGHKSPGSYFQAEVRGRHRGERVPEGL